MDCFALIIKTKNMKKIFITILAVSFILSACEKGTGYLDPSLPATGAKVKFVNMSWNAPGVIFYGKDTILKFSAALAGTGGILLGTGVGATFPSNDYAVLAPYSGALRIRIPVNATVSPGLFFDLGNIDIQDGKNYSVYLVDSFPLIKALVVNDDLKNFNLYTDSSYGARLVVGIFATPSGQLFDLFSKNENRVIAPNIANNTATSFMELKVWPVADEIQVRLAGTTTIVAKLAQTPVGHRTYTWFARGRYGALVAPGLPILSFYTNQ